jgi:hypothetical protein
VKDWIPLLAAMTAAVVALVGYWLTNRVKRLDAKAEAYAKALAAIEAYKTLPYRIRRRAGTEDSTAELRHLISDVQQEIAFYRRWLALESMEVGLAFQVLADKVMDVGADWRREAWKKGPAVSDDGIDFVDGYEYQDQWEQLACIDAMRKDLGRRRKIS